MFSQQCAMARTAPAAGIDRLTPARTAFRAFRNASNLAELLDLDRSTVCRWDWPKSKRGTGGKIPSKYHEPILALAARENVPLSTDDIIFGRAA